MAVKRKLYTAKQKAAARLARNKKRREEKQSEKVKQIEIDIKTVGTRNKEIRDADLRLKLSGLKTVDRINIIVDEFTLLDQRIKQCRNTKKNPNRLQNMITRNTSRGQLLKTQADLLFKKLNKLLPDIKSIEHSGTFKPSKPDNLPEDDLIDILKGNVDIDEVLAMFPQYKELLLDTLDTDKKAMN